MGWDFDLGLWGFKSFFYYYYYFFFNLVSKTGIFNFVEREKKELTELQSGKKKKKRKKKKLGTNKIDLSSTIFFLIMFFCFL